MSSSSSPHPDVSLSLKKDTLYVSNDIERASQMYVAGASLKTWGKKVIFIFVALYNRAWLYSNIFYPLTGIIESLGVEGEGAYHMHIAKIIHGVSFVSLWLVMGRGEGWGGGGHVPPQALLCLCKWLYSEPSLYTVCSVHLAGVIGSTSWPSIMQNSAAAWPWECEVVWMSASRAAWRYIA